MAIGKSPLLENLSGKIGNLIIYQMNGKTVIRQKPDPGKKRKLSPLQLYYQRSFRVCQEFLRPLKRELDFGYQEFFDLGKRGFQLAMSWALKNALENQGNDPVLNPEKIKISRGDLTGGEGASVVRNSETQLQFNWVNNSWSGSARETDRVFLVAYHRESEKVISKTEGSFRESGSDVLELPWIDPLIGEVHVYMAFSQKKSKGMIFSESGYLGKV